MSKFFGSDLHVINVGVSDFADSMGSAGGLVTEVDWRPPGGSEEVARLLGSLVNHPTIEAANSEAFSRYLGADPCLVGVDTAAECIPEFGDRMLLHSGPPIEWENMCEPVRGAIIGACIYESWASSPEEALSLAKSGEILFAPCHEHQAVGPMAGIISPSMPVWIVENGNGGNLSYSSFNEGLGKVLRFGAYDGEVMQRLEWMQKVLAPLLCETLKRVGRIDLGALMAQALHMGDELHNRCPAATGLLLKRLVPDLVEVNSTPSELKSCLQFMGSNDHFFLNISMAACKVTLDAAHGVPYSTMVTTIARNGVEIGLRVSGLGDEWVTCEAPIIDGLFFPGFDSSHANPDLGDSSITETAGLGGFAMAAAPAIVQFVGGTAEDANASSRSMSAITTGVNQKFTIPNLNFQAIHAGIDVRKVVDTGTVPIINTGIAHKDSGVGQIGAGISHVPQQVFLKALNRIGDVIPNAD